MELLTSLITHPYRTQAMTLSIRPELTSPADLISSLFNQQQPTVTDAEIMQALCTLLIGLEKNPDG
jgi:GTP cyclohydrolase I